MMVRGLYDGKFSPIADNIMFLEIDAKSAVDAFVDWMGAIQKTRGVSLARKNVAGDLETVMGSLLPLTSVELRRHLFVPTRSNWVAYFDNGHRGTDPSHIHHLSRALSCRGARAVWVPGAKDGPWPAVIFELFGPGGSAPLNYIRSIYAAYDGYRWEFGENGDVLPAEEPENYLKRIKKERFTADALDRVLRSLGIDAFNPEFYLPTGTKATVVEKVGPMNPAVREFPLPRQSSG